MPVEYTPHQSEEHETIRSASAEYDTLSGVRYATHSPSLLTRVLLDPLVAQSLSKPSKHKREGSRSSRSPHRSPSVVARSLVDEDRQTNTLKVLLRNAGEMLEYEVRRGDESASRADYAERRVRELLERMTIVESKLRETELEGSRREQETRRYQSQLEAKERELIRTQDDVKRLEQLFAEADDSAEKAKESCRRFQQALSDYEAREEGLAALRQERMQQSFDDGQEDGWNEGHAEGYQEGRRAGFQEGLKMGRKEGVSEGREQGRIEERRNALDAFDRFLESEAFQGRDEDDEPTRRWAQSVYRSTASEPETVGSRPPSPNPSSIQFRR